ncbi:MAG: ABC transporter substrate-binding protein [Alphaproteobacteria bacterium]|nr:ABC transporter substrate-binding protein [Alphaproteobacteria bacterium]
MRKGLASGGALLALLATGGAKLTWFDESMPTTLNPLFDQTMVDRRAQALIFDPLFRRTGTTHEFRGVLAAGFARSEDGRSVRIELVPGVRWHDGQPLTAADVCFTVGALLDPSTPTTIAHDRLEGCTATGDLTATVAFRTPQRDPRDALTFPIVPAHAFTSSSVQPDNDFAIRPVGTGPMKGSRDRREVRYEAFDNPHHRPAIREAAFNEGGDPFVQLRTFLAGGVHGILDVPPSLRPELAAQGALRRYDQRTWWFVGVNPHREALAQPDVRAALDAAIDREALIEQCIGKDDTVQPMSGPFVPASAYVDPDVPLPTRDLAVVKERMERAGATEFNGAWLWKGTPITLRVGIRASLEPRAAELLEQLVLQLRSAGFEASPYRFSDDDWFRAVRDGDPGVELLIGSWTMAESEDVSPLFHTRIGGEGRRNVTGYGNREVDALLERYRTAATDTEAQQTYRELHRKLAADRPYLFLWKLDTASAWRDVRNVEITPSDYFGRFDAWTW